MQKTSLPGKGFLYSSALVLVVAVGLPGCATLDEGADYSNAVDIDRVDSRQARIGRVRVRRFVEGLKVSGELSRRRKGFSRIPGHLHIIASDKNGVSITEKRAAFRRHQAKSRQAYFSETLAVQSSEVATIEVIHHAKPDQNSS